MKIRVLILLLFGLLSATITAHAQHLYSKERDDVAQQAESLAKDIATGTLFDQQLSNLDQIGKQELARVFLGRRRTMRANISALMDWQGINTLVTNMDSALPPTPTSDTVN